MATNGRTVTVLGGTGFLGRRIVRHLRDREFLVRIASRHDIAPFPVLVAVGKSRPLGVKLRIGQ